MDDNMITVHLSMQGIKTLQSYLNTLGKVCKNEKLYLSMRMAVFSGLSKDGYYTGTKKIIEHIFGSDLEHNIIDNEKLSISRSR